MPKGKQIGVEETNKRQIDAKKYNFIFQKIICDYYKLQINDKANAQFNANYIDEYKNELIPVIKNIFKILRSKPIELLTFTDKISDPRETTSPHNFLLKNKKTLSIKIVPQNNKIPPNTVGQAGIPVLNSYFKNIYGKKIENQDDIKELMYNKIDECLPTFIDYFFMSDYTILISPKNYIKIINKDKIEYVSFSRDDFDFTRDPNSWNVSTTLKYHNISIAEIEVPKNRNFNFRFIITTLDEFIDEINNETLGISTEAAICEVFNLEKPDNFASRTSKKYIKILKPIVREAFKNMPPAIDHSGSTVGERGGQSKCSYDFLLEGDLKLSVKTNKLSKSKPYMVCPPEVGQPCPETCFLYFSEFFPEGTSEVTRKNFKEMVLNDNIHKLIPIYIEHLFDSDWLLWIYEVKNGYEHKEISKTQIREYVWEKEKFTFTKKSVDDWNVNNTVKYNSITIGEYEVHNTRNSLLFRFNMKNLLEMILK